MIGLQEAIPMKCLLKLQEEFVFFGTSWCTHTVCVAWTLSALMTGRVNKFPESA